MSEIEVVGLFRPKYCRRLTLLFNLSHGHGWAGENSANHHMLSTRHSLTALMARVKQGGPDTARLWHDICLLLDLVGSSPSQPGSVYVRTVVHSEEACLAHVSKGAFVHLVRSIIQRAIWALFGNIGCNQMYVRAAGSRLVKDKISGFNKRAFEGFTVSQRCSSRLM